MDPMNIEQGHFDDCVNNTVDGRNPEKNVEVGTYFIALFTTGFIHPRWLFGMSEPSTVDVCVCVILNFLESLE